MFELFRSGRHLVDPHVLVAVLAEHLVGSLEDALAPLLRAQPPARMSCLRGSVVGLTARLTVQARLLDTYFVAN